MALESENGLGKDNNLLLKAYIGRSLYDYNEKRQNRMLMIDVGYRCIEDHIRSGIIEQVGKETYMQNPIQRKRFRDNSKKYLGSPEELMNTLKDEHGIAVAGEER